MNEKATNLKAKLSMAKSRAMILQEIRNFFTNQSFLEVETPIMTTIPGMEPHLNPFETKFMYDKNKKKSPKSMYLNTSPELQMKKLLGAGFGNVFTICKTFRNGEIGGDLHNPEFTMLEWYREKANYTDIMKDCENLISHIAKKITQPPDFIPKPPWPRISIHEIFMEYAKIDLLKNRTFEKLKKTAKSLDYDTNACSDWDDLYFKIFLNQIEPCMPKTPVFLYDYPVSQAALAKKSKNNPFWAERFELYINRTELANAFSELTDSKEQRKRLREEQTIRKKLKKPIFSVDENFLASLESIKHPCAGIALGIDRLIMVMLNIKSIKAVLLFPAEEMF